MSEILFIQIPNKWLILQQSSLEIIAEGEYENLSEISAHSLNRKVVAILPFAEASLYYPTVPAGSISKISNTIPYILEDELADDVENLHFALGKKIAQQLPVLVANKEDIRNYLDDFKQAGIKLNNLVVIGDCLPQDLDINIIFIDEVANYFIIQAKNKYYYALDLVNFPTALHSFSNQLDENPHEVILYVHGKDLEKFHAQVEQQQFSIIEQHTVENSLKFFADNYLKYPDHINILQNQFAMSKEDKEFRKNIFLLSGLFITWLIIWFSGEVIAYWRYTKYVDNLDQKITTEFNKIFPNTALPADPRELLTRKIAEITKGTTDASLISLLTAVAQVLKDLPNVYLLSANYNQNILNITMQLDKFESLDQVNKKLKEKNLKVEQQGVEQQKNNVIAKLKIMR